MRILYGVTGHGLGHTMRARAIAHHLIAQGHDVLVAASGRAIEILRRHGLTVVAIDGMAMRYRKGEMRRAQTVVSLLRQAPSALAKNAEVARGAVLAFDPQLVVTDFDSFAHAVGRVLDLPVVSLDHQHVVDRFRHPAAVKEKLSSSYGVGRAVVTAKTPGCKRYIVTSFFFPEPKRAATLVGPIIRPEIERARPTDGDHVLVYQTASGDPRLLAALTATPRVRFVLYGLGIEQRIGNVEMRAFDEDRFIADLASARAVIANGGFTTLSEALYLGKPVLSVPIARQPEQELNAAYLDHLGFGMFASKIDPVVVRSFLGRSFVRPEDARMRTGTVDAARALDDAIAEVA